MHPIETGLALLKRQKFDAYEQLILDEQAAYELSPEEFLKLGTALEACTCVLASVDTATMMWLKQSPDTYAAQMARATFLQAKGRAARGEDAAGNVTPAGWRTMRECYTQAYGLYVQASERVSVPTLPLNNIGDLIWVGGNGVTSGHHFSGERNWYEYGLARDPQSVMLRRTYLTILRPEWGGSIEAMRKYLNDPIHASLTPANALSLRRHSHSVSGFYLVAFGGDTEAGFRELEASIACDVNSPWPYYWRGLSRVHNDEPEFGLADYAKALTLDPESVEILNAEAQLLKATHPHDPRIDAKFRRLCDLGQHEAFNRYAWYLRDDLNDLAGALAIWQRGADEGIGECNYFVGNAYEKNLGVKTDFEFASRMFEQSYQRGDLYAASRIWWLAIRNQAHHISVDNAGRLLVEAAIQYEHADSHYWLAMAIVNRGLRYALNTDSAFDAGGEKISSSNRLSLHMEAPSQTLNAPTSALFIHHLTEAAAGGIAAAQSELARKYRNGVCVKQDFAQARQWLDTTIDTQRGSDANDALADAQQQLAHMMLSRETDGSPEHAFALLSDAADAGNGAAKLDLARCHRDGVGTQKDIAAAKSWTEKARLAGEQLPADLGEKLDAKNHSETVPRSIILHLIFGPIAFVWTLLVSIFGKRSIFKTLLWSACAVAVVFIGLVVFTKLNSTPLLPEESAQAKDKAEKAKPAWLKRVEDKAKANAASKEKKELSIGKQ